MKQILISLNFVLIFSVISVAQNKPTKLEIEQTKQAIQQGRNEIVKNIISGNHSRAVYHFKTLQKKFGQNYVILYPREELLLAFATRNFETFIDSAIVYSPVIQSNKKALKYANFRDSIYNYLLPEILLISKELEESNLPEKHKEVIRIYIQYLFDENASALNKSIKQYQRKISRQLFKGFFNSLRRLRTNNRLNFSVGYSYEGIGGPVDQSYYDVISFPKIELDGFIQKTYFSLYIGGGFSDVTPGVPVINETGETLQEDEKKVSSLKFGSKLGRILYSNNSIKLYPYISVGGYEFTPPSVLYTNHKTTEPAALSANTLFAGAGVSCDILLRKWKTKKMYDPEGYFFIRPNLGYDKFLTDKKIDHNNNFYFSVSLGVSIGSK